MVGPRPLRGLGPPYGTTGHDRGTGLEQRDSVDWRNEQLAAHNGAETISREECEGGYVISFDTVREIAGGLPGAVEGTSYGTPAFHVGKTLFVRQHQDGESLVVRIDPDERAVRVAADPKTYSVTDHYVNYPWVLVRMASVERRELKELLKEAWRLGTTQGDDGKRKRRTAHGRRAK